jgi:hypothetical protein
LRAGAAASVEASAFSRTKSPTVCPRVAGTVEMCVTKLSVVTMLSWSGMAPGWLDVMSSILYRMNAAARTQPMPPRSWRSTGDALFWVS